MRLVSRVVSLGLLGLGCLLAARGMAAPGLVLTAGGAAGEAGTSTGAPVHQPPLEVSLQVEELLPEGWPATGTPRWRLRYRLSRPVAGLYFHRSRHRFRVASWTIPQGQPVRWGEHDGKEVLLPDERGRPFREVVLELPSDTTERASDYRLNYRLSDGSQLLYTGHLEVRALECHPGSACEPEDLQASTVTVSTRLALRAARGRKVALLDRQEVGGLVWELPPYGYEVGTYAYFGTLPRLEDPRFRMILDPGLPDWMEKAAAQLLPRAFEFFARLTGAELDLRPLILISFEGDSGEELAHKGGVLDGAMQLHLSGSGWVGGDLEARRRWAKLLCHESFHFWNGLMSRYRLGASDRWLSEGGADYFAYAALRSFGEIDRESFLRAMAEAANNCLAKLHGRPLTMVAQTGADYRLVYTCGMTLHYLAELQLQAATDGRRSLGDLYRRLFEKAARNDRSYSTFDFLELLQQMSDKPLATAPHERVLHLGVGQRAEDFFAHELGAVGAPFELVALPAAEQGDDIAGPLLARLVAACDCKGRWSFQFTEDAVEYVPVDGCGLFQARTRVTHVAEQPIRERAAAAYQAALQEIDGRRPLRLRRARSEPVNLPCPAGRVRSFPRRFFRLED